MKSEIIAICKSDQGELLKVGYDEIDLRAIEPYFSRMDGATARAYLAQVFYWGRRKRTSLIKIIIAVEESWEKVWRHGTPDRLGDPDDVAAGGIGMANISAFLAIYPRIGLPVPKFPF